MLSLTYVLNKPILHTHPQSFMCSLVVAWLPPSLGVGAHGHTEFQVALS